MNQSLKDRAFARRKRVKLEPVPMPEWGEGSVVHVREMSGAERDAYEAQQVERNKSGKGLENFRARLVVATACDESGAPLFGADEVDAVGELPAPDVRRLFDAAARLNALTSDDEKDLEKNS